MKTFGSLFAGIGGIDLGLERAGWTCKWQVEINDYCQRVLAKHWPDVQRYGDVKECHDLPYVDLIAGGFPCQPVSVAGKRKGEKDERWLWDDFYRVICETRPEWVLVENVPGLYSARNGKLFGGILRDLSVGGYDAEWDAIPAAAFGAPHRRFRCFIVARTKNTNTECDRRDNEGRLTKTNNRSSEEGCIPRRESTPLREDVPNTISKRGCSGDTIGQDAENVGQSSSGEGLLPVTQRKRGRNRDVRGRGVEADAFVFSEFWTDNRTRETRDAAWAWWNVEPDVGRVAHGIPSRVDRLRSLGNAVVPQVAEWIGRRILESA